MNINQVSVNGASVDPATQQSDKVATSQNTTTNKTTEGSQSVQAGVIVELGKPKDAPVTYGHLKSQPTIQTLGNGLGKPPPTIAATAPTLDAAATGTIELKIGNGLGKPPP